MIKATVTLHNMDVFDLVPDEIVKIIDENLSETASLVEVEAKTTAAFIDRTHNLRNSIRKSKSRYPNGGYIVKASGSNGGKYKGYHAHLVEFGHVLITWGKITGRRVKPHPFMRPAAEQGIKKAIDLFRENMK